MILNCTTWSSTDAQWSQADWTWDDCQVIADICPIWGETSVLWKNANWLWSRCSGSIPPQPPTGSVFVPLPGIDATTLIQPWLKPDEPWDAYKEMKRKRLIKLICKVKGTRYEEEKESREFNVSVNDIKMVVKAVAKVDLTIHE